jgi:hypothetical protein
MSAGPVLTIVVLVVATTIARLGGMHHEEVPWVAVVVVLFLGPPATIRIESLTLVGVRRDA